MTIQNGGKFDVVVCGGGPAGITAAIAAARSGAHTLLIESFPMIGGAMTNGHINQWQNFHGFGEYAGIPIVGGITLEIAERAQKAGAASPFASLDPRPGAPLNYSWIVVDPELTKCLLVDILDESKVELLLNSFVYDVIKKGDKIVGILTANKSGSVAIEAGVVIDCTGDADVIVAAGAPYDQPENRMGTSTMMRIAGINIDKVKEYIVEHPEEFESIDFPEVYIKSMQTPETLRELPHWALMIYGFQNLVKKGREAGEWQGRHILALQPSVRKGEVVVNASNVLGDPTSGEGLTKLIKEGMQQALVITNFMRKYLPGCEECYLANIAPLMGVREGRRAIGEYVLTLDDCLNPPIFPDAIAKSHQMVNLHRGGEPIHSWDTKPVGIPYRCLVPLKVDNLLVAGRCYSCTQEALATTRMISTPMVLGQAAGVAAAMSCEKNVAPRNLDANELREVLTKQSQIL